MDATYSPSVLNHVKDNLLVFHNGLWGAEMCYMWSSTEPGRGSGRVSQSVSETLDRLWRLGLVTVTPGRGATDVPVVLTDAGADYLRSANQRAA